MLTVPVRAHKNTGLVVSAASRASKSFTVPPAHSTEFDSWSPEETS